MQNRRDDRLRSDVAENLELLKELRGEEETWADEIRQLDQLVRLQLSAAVDRQQLMAEHRRDWAALGATVFVLAIGGALAWLFAWLAVWWAWVLFVLVLTFTLILAAIGVSQTFRPPLPEASAATASGGPGT
jgi:hypothetical protein